MDFAALARAMLLGTVEGFTEFLPVSSTGHLLLLQHMLGVGDDDFGKTFAVLIQLGAILAIVLVYLRKLIAIAAGFFSDRQTRNFVFAVVVAFLPAAVIGGLFSQFIKGVLFNPLIVCVSLIVGGIVLRLVDDAPLKAERHDIFEFSIPMCLKIGCFQCLAMIPGVSRSGATIVGAMLMGADKRSAAEFSFFLAMPTMAGAFTLDLYKNYHLLTADGAIIIATGFAAAFIAGLIVVRGFLDFISHHGFTPFAWWRIILGSAGLAWLYAVG
jgi:undecaprenyl-diphosphatase